MSHTQCANEFITSHHLKWHTFLISTEEEIINQFPGHSGFHAPLLSLNAECTNIRLISGSPYSQSACPRCLFSKIKVNKPDDRWKAVLSLGVVTRALFFLYSFFVYTVYLIFLPFLQVAWLFNSLLSCGEDTL